jgi:hypothetical protein
MKKTFFILAAAFSTTASAQFLDPYFSQKAGENAATGNVELGNVSIDGKDPRVVDHSPITSPQPRAPATDPFPNVEIKGSYDPMEVFAEEANKRTRERTAAAKAQFVEGVPSNSVFFGYALQDSKNQGCPLAAVDGDLKIYLPTGIFSSRHVALRDVRSITTYKYKKTGELVYEVELMDGTKASIDERQMSRLSEKRVPVMCVDRVFKTARPDGFSFGYNKGNLMVMERKEGQEFEILKRK